MAVKMLRKPSETPNITNIDDIIAMRYAYGNQNGYVKGKGTELSYEINGLNFTINSGRLVIQGVEVDIDANGITLEIDNVSNLRYFIVYAKVDLGLNNVEIVATHNSLGYPVLPTSQDLTQYTNGIAYLELYRFTTTGASISNVIKVVNYIEYYKDKIDKVINGDIPVKTATTATSAGNVTSKINDKDISEIFEADGITVKNSKILKNIESYVGYNVGTFVGLPGIYVVNIVYTPTDNSLNNGKKWSESVILAIPNLDQDAWNSAKPGIKYSGKDKIIYVPTISNANITRVYGYIIAKNIAYLD